MPVFKNRAARWAALGLLLCFGYAMTSPMARPLPDIPEAVRIHTALSAAEVGDVSFLSGQTERVSLHQTASTFLPDWTPSLAANTPAYYTADALMTALSDLRFQRFLSADQWSDQEDQQWLRRYGQPQTMRLAVENGFLYLHFWPDTRQVLVTAFSYASEIGGAWTGTSVYFLPLGCDLRSIVRTAYRNPRMASV